MLLKSAPTSKLTRVSESLMCRFLNIFMKCEGLSTIDDYYRLKIFGLISGKVLCGRSKGADDRMKWNVGFVYHGKTVDSRSAWGFFLGDSRFLYFLWELWVADEEYSFIFKVYGRVFSSDSIFRRFQGIVHFWMYLLCGTDSDWHIVFICRKNNDVWIVVKVVETFSLWWSCSGRRRFGYYKKYTYVFLFFKLCYREIWDGGFDLDDWSNGKVEPFGWEVLCGFTKCYIKKVVHYIEGAVVDDETLFLCRAKKLFLMNACFLETEVSVSSWEIRIPGLGEFWLRIVAEMCTVNFTRFSWDCVWFRRFYEWELHWKICCASLHSSWCLPGKRIKILFWSLQDLRNQVPKPRLEMGKRREINKSQCSWK